MSEMLGKIKISQTQSPAIDKPGLVSGQLFPPEASGAAVQFSALGAVPSTCLYPGTGHHQGNSEQNKSCQMGQFEDPPNGF